MLLEIPAAARVLGIMKGSGCGPMRGADGSGRAGVETSGRIPDAEASDPPTRGVAIGGVGGETVGRCPGARICSIAALGQPRASGPQVHPSRSGTGHPSGVRAPTLHSVRSR